MQGDLERLSRRGFLGGVAGGLAAAAVSGGARAEGTPLAASRPVLGRTGLRPSLLGMGTGTKAWNKNSAQIRRGEEVFVGNLLHAHARGVRFFDLADQYGSHEYMRRALTEGKLDRGELFILTKTNAKDAAGVRDDLDRMRREAGVEYFDAVLLHCMTEADWPEKMRPCMDVLAEAREKGIVRAHGVSCHSLEALNRAADSDWVQVMLSRINPWGTKMDGPPEAVVPVLQRAHASGKGMLGMKIAGEGAHGDKIAESLEFVSKQGCIHAVTIGFVERAEIDAAFESVERGWKPGG